MNFYPASELENIKITFEMRDNTKSQIRKSHPETEIKKLMKIELFDNESKYIFSISASCCYRYSLYAKTIEV